MASIPSRILAQYVLMSSALGKEAADAYDGQRVRCWRVVVRIGIVLCHERYSLMCMSSSGSIRKCGGRHVMPWYAEDVGASEQTPLRIGD